MKKWRDLKIAWGVRVFVAFLLLGGAVVLCLPYKWIGSLPSCFFDIRLYIVKGICVCSALLCLCRRKNSLPKFLFGLILFVCFLTLAKKWIDVYIYVRNQLFFSSELSVSPDVVRLSPSADKLIALTFDDGPIRGKTDALLEVLRYEDVHATFFVVGCNIEGNEDLILRMHAAGNEIANHGWAHLFTPIYLPSTAIENFNHCNQAIENVIGRKTDYFRLPYAAGTLMHLAAIRKNCNMRAVFWNVDAEDYRHDGDSRYCERVLSSLPEQGPVICLCHDHGISPRGLFRLIWILKRRGYRFVTVSELVKAGAASAH